MTLGHLSRRLRTRCTRRRMPCLHFHPTPPTGHPITSRQLTQLKAAPVGYHIPCPQVHYLISTSVLLVRMKRKELEYKARQRWRAEAAAGGAGDAAAPDHKKER